MRNISAENLAALEARQLVARDFLWFVARDRATGAPVTDGMWSDVGNVSAAISLGGAAIGFVQPLASAIAHSVSLLDLALWGLVAWAVQLLTHFVLRAIVRDLRAKIEQDVRSVALFVAVVAACVGAINAAAMTY